MTTQELFNECMDLNTKAIQALCDHRYIQDPMKDSWSCACGKILTGFDVLEIGPEDEYVSTL